MLSIVLLTITFLLNKNKLDRVKCSTYECGLNVIDQYREEGSKEIISMRYYVRYYKVALAYLLFDIEILLLYPIVKVYSDFDINAYMLFIIIIGIIGIGLYYELTKSTF